MNMNFFKTIGSAYGSVASPQGMKDKDGNIQAVTSNTSASLIASAVGTANGGSIDVSNNRIHTVVCWSDNATAAGNILVVQARQLGTTWVTLGTTNIANTTAQTSTFEGKFAYIRGAITAHNNGSHNISLMSGR